MPNSNEIDFFAPGTSGVGVTFQFNASTFPVPGPLVISAVGLAFAFTPANDGISLITTTCAQFVAALQAYAPFQALMALGMTVSTPTPLDSMPGHPAVPTPFPPPTLAGAGDDGRLVNLGVRVKDWSGKYYSNVVGQQNPLAGFVPAALMCGFDNAQLPGIVYPEIYIPKQGQLFFDFAMLDGIVPALPADPVLTLKGMKVYG